MCQTEIESYTTVIVDRDQAEFHLMVNEKIKNGWVPLGGVSTMFGCDVVWFCQALVKYKQKLDIGEF